MTKIKYCALIISMLLSNQIFSQIKINGEIKDKKNNPIEFVEIQLQNKDSIIFKSELTNADGKFTLETEKGEYTLIVRQIGVIYHRQKIDLDKNVNLGVINVIEKQQLLQEVVVIAKKKLIERKVDRLIFNVENSISASGGDAIDALKVTPKIQVDNNGISMIGKNGMSIMIDDRLIQLQGDDLINFLKNIQSDNIKSIEVISAPPAKYDASGNSGLINIRLKKVKKGELFKSTLNTTYEQKTYATSSFGNSIYSQVKKISIYTNIFYKNGSYKVTENRKYKYPNQLWDEENKRREYNDALSGRIGLDYKNNDKNEFGLIYFGSLNNPSNKEIDNTQIYNNDNQLTSYYSNTNANRKIKEFTHSFNTHYKKTLDTLGKSITANLDYFVTNQDTKRNFITNSFVNDDYSYLNVLNNGNQNIKITTSNIDVELPYTKIKYTFGGKISFIKTNNDFKFYNVLGDENILDITQSNEFNYTENTQALYFDISNKIKKWEFKIGLRGENTQTKGYSINLNQTNTNNYFKLFPTIYTTYTLNEKNVFSIDYSRRVGRPSYYMTNPFRTYTNNYSYLEGNPFIQPEFNNNIELSHTYNDNLYTAISFGYLENGKSQIQILDPNTNISKSTYLNFFKVYNYSFDIYYSFKKIKWLESNNSANLSNRKTVANELLNNQIVKQTSFNFSSNNTINLNKSKTIFSSVELLYKSKQIINIFEIGEVFNTNIGFKYLLPNKKIQITLNFYDIFKTNIYRSSSFSNGVQSISKNYYDDQTFRISLLYKFGNNKINVREKRGGNESESRRTN